MALSDAVGKLDESIDEWRDATNLPPVGCGLFSRFFIIFIFYFTLIRKKIPQPRALSKWMGVRDRLSKPDDQ